MNLDEILAGMQSKAANLDPINATLKISVDANHVYVDGTGDSNVITMEDKEADCVISTTADTMQKLLAGDVNPMMAVMTGKVKVKGDMGVAMKVQSLLS
ncbi:MAG: SCP2 sterol-binding domain-containing protein [Bacteroidota bacterium]